MNLYTCIISYTFIRIGLNVLLKEDKLMYQGPPLGENPGADGVLQFILR